MSAILKSSAIPPELMAELQERPNAPPGASSIRRPGGSLASEWTGCARSSAGGTAR